MNYGHIMCNNVESIESLRNKYNIPRNYVGEVIPTHGKSKWVFVKDIPYDDCQKIINMYKDGYNSYDIADAFGICYKHVIHILDNNNIDRIYSGGTRTYSLNEHYFDIIDTPNKAYILGFLYADGNVSLQNNIIRINLQCDDFEILEKMRIEMSSSRPLSLQVVQSDNPHNINAKDQFVLSMQSYIMCQALISHGCYENKSLKLSFPKLKDELYSHFLRGYFDGDGSISKNKSNYILTMTSTNQFLIEAKDIINKRVGINGGGIYDASNHNGITKVLTYCGKRQVRAITDWLYENSELYMQRKHDRYMSYFY